MYVSTWRRFSTFLHNLLRIEPYAGGSHQLSHLELMDKHLALSNERVASDSGET